MPRARPRPLLYWAALALVLIGLSSAPAAAEPTWEEAWIRLWGGQNWYQICWGGTYPQGDQLRARLLWPVQLHRFTMEVMSRPDPRLQLERWHLRIKGATPEDDLWMTLIVRPWSQGEPPAGNAEIRPGRLID